MFEVLTKDDDMNSSDGLPFIPFLTPVKKKVAIKESLSMKRSAPMEESESVSMKESMTKILCVHIQKKKFIQVP